MTYEVAIRKNETGEVRMRKMDLDWHKPDGSDDLFWWKDGNFGCDCNRGYEFDRAAGKEPDLGAGRCGDSAFSVLYALLPNGQRVAIDEDQEPAQKARSKP